MTTGLPLAILIFIINIVSPLIFRTPKISTLQEIYAEVGFTLGPAVVLTSLYSKPEQYYNKEGPFTKEWRNTDRYSLNNSQ